ncbi:MAG: hypothetical protein VYC71_15110, partial [Planctomycetota bacterium]|nr:hypothetical protein [Planctomycetota bacterium]
HEKSIRQEARHQEVRGDQKIGENRKSEDRFSIHDETGGQEETPVDIGVSPPYRFRNVELIHVF